MKTKEEIEQLADKHYRSNGSGGGQYTEGLQEGRLIGYVDGYTQCQEDMFKSSLANTLRRLYADKKYTEEDIRNAFFSGGVMKDIDEFNHFINSLNKQD